MRIIQLIFVTIIIIICNSCLSNGSIEPNDDNIVPLSVEQRQKIVNKLINNKIKLTKTNENVLFHIVKDFTLKDFMKLVESKKIISSTILQLLRRKYKTYHIEILKTKTETSELVRDIAPEKLIVINDLYTATEIIKHIGPVINRIEVRNKYILKNESMIVNQFIDRYCAKSLIHLDLDSIKINTFETFTSPFNKLEELAFSVDVEKVRVGTLPLNDLFPNLKRLHMKFHSYIDFKFINYAFSKLEHLDLYASDIAWEQKRQIEAFVAKNLHVRSLEFSVADDYYIKDINEIFPHLENFTIQSFDVGNAIIRFDNVKHFTLKTPFAPSIAKLSFPHLESLTFKYASTLFNEWMGFMRKHSNITHLDLTEFYKGTDVPLIELTAQLPELIVMKVTSKKCACVDIISQLFDGHKKLMRMELKFDQCVRGNLEKISNQFDDEWLIDMSYDDIDYLPRVIFQRKHSFLLM